MKNNFNPPFSLFREYVRQLMDFNKKFIVLGNMNSILCKEIFPYVKNNLLWWGVSIHSGDRKFYVPENYPLDAAGCGIDENGCRFIRVKGVRWWTNIENKNREIPLDLYKRYSSEYQKFDEFDAINVNKTTEIPMDYDGVMGVPITFFDKYCPEQFEIVDGANRYLIFDSFGTNEKVKLNHGHSCNIDGKATYFRILIRKRREYIKQLMDYNKKFIIIGNTQAITYKEIFPYIKNNELWLGVSMNGANRWFYAPDNYEVKENAAGYKVEDGRKMFFVNGVVWFTNISNEKRNKKLDLFRRYSNEYPKYDNYDAIEVSRVENIPMDYDGVMGVPISFLHKYCPEQFEIVWCSDRGGDGKIENLKIPNQARYDAPTVNGVGVYKRIFIKRLS